MKDLVPAVKEQEDVSDNTLDREKSKTHYINEKSAISKGNDPLRFSSQYSKENKYLEDKKISEKEIDIEGIKDLVIKENNV